MVTRQVSTALCRTNTSDRNASHILAAVACTSQLGPKPPDVADLVLSHSAIRRARQKFRSDFAAEVKASFNPEVPLVLHWDGKVMEHYTGFTSWSSGSSPDSSVWTECNQVARSPKASRSNGCNYDAINC